MEEKAVELLSQLAKALGVSTDFVLQALYKQIPVYVIDHILFLVLWVAVGFGAYKWFKWSIKMAKDEDDEIFYALSVVSCAIMGIMAIILITNITHMLTALMNPDYYVFEQIKSIMGGR